ncbi:MAG: BON domain-containing protein [Gammaproteobacteria bacterium]|nr:BON domain-containing protein [Gammaproteobacteria bacterium]
MKRLIGATLATLLIVTSLQGCAPIIVAGAATSAIVTQDRRSAGTILDDQTSELKITNAIHSDTQLIKNARIKVTVFNGVALLLGQVPSEQHRKRAAAHARQNMKIKQVNNEIKITTPIGLKVQNNDAAITFKVKSSLLSTRGVTSGHFKVVSERGIVYLMGLVTRKAGDTAARITQRVKGVQGIVKVFEYIEAP